MASSTLTGPRRAALDSLTADLQAIFRNRLRAVCAYGLDGRDEQDLHTIAFVDQLHFDDLAACAPRTRGWQNRGLAVPLILQPEEFLRSLDVFPLEYGDIVAHPESRETVRQLVLECVAVAHAGGVSLPEMDYVDMVWRFAEKVGQVYSSTSQDLTRGKRTEIDTLNGFVVRRGADLGVPTPVNQSLLALVKLREAQFDRAFAAKG